MDTQHDTRITIRWQEQRLRWISGAAYRLSEARQSDGSPGSQDEDWFVAEWEYDVASADSVFGRWRYKIAPYAHGVGHDERIQYAVLYCVAAELRTSDTGFGADTPLPQDLRRLERICAAVARALWLRRFFPTPVNVGTVGDLTKAILALDRD